MRRVIGCGCLLLSLAAPSATAGAAPMAVGAPVRAPAAFYQFCARDPASCRPAGPIVSFIALTPQRLAALNAVTQRVNHSVKETPDIVQYGVDDYWSYPVNGKGDCEDYVLEKRRELITAGWPSSVLLITVVRDAKGDGHAVLTVVTDRGDMVLDSRIDPIRKWSETPYTYYTRQSSGDPRSFVTVTNINPSAVGPAAVAMRAAKLDAGAVASAGAKDNGKGSGASNANSNAGGNRDNSHSNAGGNSASASSNSNAGGNSASASSNSNAGGNSASASSNSNAGGNGHGKGN